MKLETKHEIGNKIWDWKQNTKLETKHEIGNKTWNWEQNMKLETKHEIGNKTWNSAEEFKYILKYKKDHLKSKLPTNWNLIGRSMTSSPPVLSPSNILLPSSSHRAFISVRKSWVFFQKCCWSNSVFQILLILKVRNFVCLYTHTHTHIYIYMYIYTHRHIYRHKYRHRYTYIHAHIYIYIQIYIYTHIYKHTDIYTHRHKYIYTYIIYTHIYTHIYRVSQEECARLRESVPYVKVYRYNPKHLCPKLNG